MHYYQFNIGDYASSTAHLEPLEDLAYRRLLDLYYSSEQAIPEDLSKVARLVRMRTHSDFIATVLNEFFTLENDGWHCDRADVEIFKYNEKSYKASKSAKARWKKAKSKQKVKKPCERIANAEETHSDGNAKQEPLTTNQEPVIKDLLCEKAFEIFYSAGLVKKSKVPALSKFKTLVKGMGASCDPMEFANLLKSDIEYRINNNQFGIDRLHPSTYLNQQRWTDEHETANPGNNGQSQGNSKLSAPERIRERNEATYGGQQSGGGLGLATDGGDIR